MENIEYLKGNIAEVEITYKSKIKQSEMYKVSKSDNVATLCRCLFDDGQIEHREQMIIICMNKANKVLGYSIIGIGGISGVVADPKIMFQIALKMNASSIIISHNHPSGQLTPSDADKTITTKIREAGKLLDIALLDHVIITSEGYYSFADEGYI